MIRSISCCFQIRPLLVSIGRRSSLPGIVPAIAEGQAYSLLHIAHRAFLVHVQIDLLSFS